MKKIQYIPFIFCLGICALTAGCGYTGTADASKQKPEGKAAAEELSDLAFEQEDAYQQMALYIQEGLRTYDIEGTYQVYFGELGKSVCEILLEGENEWWEERISCSYDAENGWYTFRGEYEPIFRENPFIWEQLAEDSDYVKKMRENYVYSTQISKNQDIVSNIHYHSENGPVECDIWKMVPDTENSYVTPYFLRPYLYTYYDDRMKIYITIEYPQICLKDDVLEGKINEALKNAFFYSYDYDDEESRLNPREQTYGEITRNYVITRLDEAFFSMRIFEYNNSRGANHPNKLERGITVDMKTGEVLCLQDVISGGWTPVSLLDTGAFHCISPEIDEENWMRQVRESWEHDRYAELSSLDSKFYLTQDGLGLITEVSRYYGPIEASFEELGLELEIDAGG